MDVMPNRMVKAGEPVFSEGDSAEEGLYYICYGTVEISRHEPGGDRKLAELGEGSVFGEMAIINSDARNATVIAKTDCGLFTINRRNFQHKVEQLDPFMRGVFRVLVMELRDFAEKRGEWLAAIEDAYHNPPAAMAPAATSAAAPSVGTGGEVNYSPVRDRDVAGNTVSGGGLASGEVRKLQF